MSFPSPPDVHVVNDASSFISDRTLRFTPSMGRPPSASSGVVPASDKPPFAEYTPALYAFDPRDDVKLSPHIFRDACKHLHWKPSADLFANSAHHQLDVYYPGTPDPAAKGVDAFTFDWQLEAAPYAKPPWPLIPLAKIIHDRVRGMVVVSKFGRPFGAIAHSLAYGAWCPNGPHSLQTLCPAEQRRRP